MKRVEHLSAEQLAAYAAGTLQSHAEKQEIGQHLFECSACRSLMPAPTSEVFLAALMTENPRVNLTGEISGQPERQTFWLPSFLCSSHSLAWSLGALVIVLSCTTFLWFYADRSDSDYQEDVARTNHEKKEVEGPAGNTPNFTSSPDLPDNSKVGSGKISKSLNSLADSPRIAKNVGRGSNGEPENKAESNNRVQDTKRNSASNDTPPVRESSPNSNAGKVTVALSRSLGDCPPGTESFIVSPYFETITTPLPILRWKLVPEALKYDIYVSDSAQILIEKATVTGEGSYKLTSVLETGKSYRWKVIATLRNNQTLSSDVIDFTVGSNAQKYPQKRMGRMKDNPKRCSL